MVHTSHTPYIRNSAPCGRAILWQHDDRYQSAQKLKDRPPEESRCEQLLSIRLVMEAQWPLGIVDQLGEEQNRTAITFFRDSTKARSFVRSFDPSFLSLASQLDIGGKQRQGSLVVSKGDGAVADV